MVQNEERQPHNQLRLFVFIGEVYSVTDGVQLDATAQEYVVELVQAVRSFGFIKLNNSPGTGERKNWTVCQIHQQPSGCYALAVLLKS